MTLVDTPAILRGSEAALWYMRFARDPLQAVARSRSLHGPFVQLPYPRLRQRANPRTFLVASGADFNREVLGNPSTWEPVNVGPPGPKNSAARRLARGILLGMTGRKHEHYRRPVACAPAAQRHQRHGHAHDAPCGRGDWLQGGVFAASLIHGRIRNLVRFPN